MLHKIFYHSKAIFFAYLSRVRQVKIEDLGNLSVSAALRFIFTSSPAITVVQIGANDGFSNDPLFPYLPKHRGRVYLIEALKFYYDKLVNLYSDTPHITPINALVGAAIGKAKFFYIDPDIAQEMDGDGPSNLWAHGQGSLLRECIIKEIKSNSFRGESYQGNIPRYINSIKSVDLDMTSLLGICETYQINSLDFFLVLDVQGIEILILQQIPSLPVPPSFVMCEVDQSATDTDRASLLELMSSIGYVKLASDTSDAIFCLPRSFSMSTR